MDILLTGASGFLGGIIQSELSSFRITTLGRAANNTIVADLTKEILPLPKVDIVVHAAGKAHFVPTTAAEEQFFFDVNVEGTRNLLKALEENPPKSFVFMSSVSVYGLEAGSLITERAPLNADGAYGRSKIEAERLITGWCSDHSVTCTILRLPLVAGRSPAGNLKSMIDGIKKGYYFNISGKPAKRSIVLGTDVALIIPKAASIGGIYHLTDGYHPTFKELSIVISRQLHKNHPKNIPFLLARLAASLGDAIGNKFPLTSGKLNKMTSSLTFSDDKAKEKLGWKSRPVLEHFKIF